MDATLEASLARLRSWNLKQSQDKLAYFRFAVPRLREAFRLFVGDEPITELHLRGPNLGTKSYTLAHYVTACLQKRQTLDGVPLPQWKGRVQAVQMVLDYKRQLHSVQPAYLQALEGWEYRARYFGEQLSSVRIKPVNGSDDETTWSTLHFLSEENKLAGVGIRADIVAFDEPPVMSILRELRKAGHANRRHIRIIAETPTVMAQWAPLYADYGDTPRRSIRRVDRYRAECRWSLDEVASWVHSAARIAELRESYKNDVLFGEDGGARWHGDYTNEVGSSPWGKLGILTLMEMLKHCTEPDIVSLPVQMETDIGEPEKVSNVKVQVWKASEHGKRYYQDIDPASGVDDGKHHESGLHQSEIGSGDLCVRWAGYLQPFQVGVLGASIGRQYNDSVIDVETNDHWGINVVRGCTTSRYGNLAYEQRELRPGQWAKEVGFKMDEKTKAILVGQIQEWIAAWGAYYQAQKEGRQIPRPYAFCPSREVIENIMACELDEKGKVVAGPGLAHGHDMILWGQKLRRAVTRSNRPIPPHDVEREVDPDAHLIAMIQGKRKPTSQAPAMSQPRQRPRI